MTVQAGGAAWAPGGAHLSLRGVRDAATSAEIASAAPRNDNQDGSAKGPRSHRRQRNGDRQLFERQNRKVASPPQIQSESSRDRVGVAGQAPRPSTITRVSCPHAPPPPRAAVPGAPAARPLPERVW